MKCELKTITPADARVMLEKNINNRSVNKGHVLQLAREMSLGRWQVNGDTICMNGNRLIDGQHRLHAVIKSGVPIVTFVVEGVDSEAFGTKDVGKRRSGADTLSVRGETNTAKLAAALAVLDRYMSGRMLKTVRYTNTDIEEILDRYPGIRRSVPQARETKKIAPASVLIAMHYLFSQKDEDEADRFIEMLIHGTGLRRGYPVYILRERLLQNMTAKNKLSQAHICALMIKAWNAHRSGKTVRCLRFCEKGDGQERFPEVM